MEFVSSEKGDGWSTVCHMHRFRLSADQQKDRLQKRNYHAKLRVSSCMTPAPRPFSGDTEDASKSQNPLAQSARTQTLKESFTGDSPFPYLEVIDDGPDFPKLVVGGVCLRKQL